jgi:hypothetical protein
MNKMIVFALLTLFITGCTPEVGSEEWCENLKEKPKGEWTVNEMSDYTKHCIFK